MKIIWTFILFSTIAFKIASKPIVPHNLELSTSQQEYENVRWNAIQLHVGSGNESNHPKVNFYFDLSSPYFIIGEINDFKNGLDCKDPSKNSCETKTTPVTPRFFFFREFSTIPAKAFFTFDSNSVQIANPEIQKYPFDLIISGNKWFLDNWGSFGIIPQGEFSKYFSQIYADSINILPHWSKNVNFGYDLRLFLNPMIIDSDVLLTVELPTEVTSWNVVGSLDFISPIWSFKESKLCLSTSDDNILIVSADPDFCDAVKKLICKGKIKNDCTFAEADLKLAPPLVLKIGGVDFSFSGEEYVYFKNNVATCRFGDIGNIRSFDQCFKESEFGLGKQFFEKYPTVFSLDYKSSSKITFLKQYVAPGRYGLGLKALIIFGIAVFIVGGYLIYKTVWKQKKEEDENYNQM